MEDKDRKKSWVKMSVPVTPEMYKAISNRARIEGQTHAAFIRSRVNDSLREEINRAMRKSP
tara:strand:- start:1201 stop:1383 length:183 start_codon:yes stop_codon:yes gene_type:complete